MTDLRKRPANPLGGYVLALVGALVLVYCAGFAFSALTSGSAIGPVGASYASGSSGFALRVVGALVGAALGAGVARLGLRHTHAIDH